MLLGGRCSCSCIIFIIIIIIVWCLGRVAHKQHNVNTAPQPPVSSILPSLLSLYSLFLSLFFSIVASLLHSRRPSSSSVYDKNFKNNNNNNGSYTLKNYNNNNNNQGVRKNKVRARVRFGRHAKAHSWPCSTGCFWKRERAPLANTSFVGRAKLASKFAEVRWTLAHALQGG